ncbi:MAG: thioredoxin-disulfide reductase [Candidatus Limnocylindrales bacterium]
MNEQMKNAGTANRSPSLTIDFGNQAAAPASSAPIAAAPPAVTPLAILGEAVAAPGGPTSSRGDGSPIHSNVVIIGSGPAGLTAAIYAGRADLTPIVLAGSAAGGQLMLTSDVENYPGFPDGIQGPDLMTAMRAQAERFGARIVDVDADRVDFGSRPFGIWARGIEYRAEAVIVATGASAMWLGLESEERLRGRGVSACATCDGFFFRDKEIAVVGGGDTALEEATYLTRFASKIHLLHRRDQFRGSRIMVDRTVANPKIEIHYNTAVDEVLGDAHVEGLRLHDTSSGDARVMPTDGLFVAIGHRPNTEIFGDWLEIDAQGYLVVRDQTGSRVEGVFIAGDVHDHRYRQAVTAAGDGCRAAIDAERWLEASGITATSAASAS